MDGYVTIETDLNTASFDAQISELEYKLETLSEEYETALKDKDFPKEELLKYEAEIENTTNKIIRLSRRQEDLGKNKFGGLISQSASVDLNFGKMLKKVTRIGLAFLGIRGGFSLIRQAMSSVLAGNDKMKKQFDGMKQSLYSAFTPVIEKIINLMKTLMAYVNYIWKRLFGKDLFANTVKSSSKTAKNVKEINKQLAGFDEANILSDNSSTSGGSGGGSTNLGLDKVKIPDWLVKIMDWVDKHPKLSKILFGLTAFTLLGGWQMASGLGNAIAGLLGSKKGGGLLGLANLLTAGAIAGVAYLTWEGFDLLGEHIAGVKELIDTYKDLKGAQKDLRKHTVEVSNANIKLDESVRKKVESGKTDLFQMNNYTSHIRDVVNENKNLMGSEGLTKKERQKLREESEKMIATYQWLYENGQLTKDQEYDYYKFLRDQMADGLDITNEKLGITKESFDKLDKKYNTKYTIDMQAEGEKKVQKSVDSVKDAFEKLGKKISEAFKLGEKTGVKVTDLAKNIFHANGGIVNMPGSGVPIHYAGEAGREGIVPMDNEGQMRLLGQEIAKYVNITNYVTNNVDSRKLNTILKQSENRERLANNG